MDHTWLRQLTTSVEALLRLLGAAEGQGIALVAL